MKFPITIPHGAFRSLVVILASLSGGLIGAMFTLALRGLPIPAEFGQMLLATGGALAALVVGPKSRDDDEGDAPAVPDAPVSPERPVSD